MKSITPLRTDAPRQRSQPLARLLALLGAVAFLDGAPGQAAPPEAATVDQAARPVGVRDFAYAVERHQADSGLLAGRQGPLKRLSRAGRPEESPEQKAARMATMLSESIVGELTKQKVRASRLAPGVATPSDGYVIEGQFLVLDEGNRLRRAVIGFGDGASEVLVEVSIFDLARSAKEPVLVFGTGKESRHMPGGIVLMNPYAMAAKYVLSRKSSEKDVRQMGKQIAKDILPWVRPLSLGARLY